MPESRSRRVLSAFGRHVVLATSAGVVLGVITALETPSPSAETSRSAWVLAHVAVCGALGLAWGVVQAPLQAIVVALARRSGLASWWNAAHDADEAAPRAPVVRFHAGAVAGVVAVGVTASTVWWLHPRVRALQVDDFAIAISSALTIVALVGAAGAAVALAVVTMPLVAWLDTRIGLPRPRRAWLRGLLLPLLAVPAALTLAIRHAGHLGAATLGVLLVALLAIEVPMALLTARWSHARGALAGAAVIGLMLVGLARIESKPEERSALFRSPIGQVGIVALRRLSDVDRDGAAPFLGGRDCAPFDGSRHPLADDVPNDGVDANCDGRDAEKSAGSGGNTEGRRLTSDALPDLERKRYNVLWVVIDAVRADHCTFMGYRRPTTPHLDALAREAMVFMQAHAQSTATSLSIPSMLYGRDSARMRWQPKGVRPTAVPTQTSVAERLGDAGYTTMAVSIPFVMASLPTALDGFPVVLDSYSRRGRRHAAADGAALAVEFLAKRDRKRPFFLFFYTDEPHANYYRHPPPIRTFGSRPIDAYDHEIAYADAHVGTVFEYLRSTGQWDDTVVVVTADHGEEFGEHGEQTHARNCYATTTHVPLVVRIPGLPHRRVERPVGLIDIVPTLLDATGVDAGSMVLDGYSLLMSTMLPELLPRDRPLFCTVAPHMRSLVQSVRASDRFLHHRLENDEVRLYATDQDPHERHPLSKAAHAEAAKRLEQLLTERGLGDLPSLLR